jgi:hypothetical protein
MLNLAQHLTKQDHLILKSLDRIRQTLNLFQGKVQDLVQSERKREIQKLICTGLFLIGKSDVKPIHTGIIIIF